MTRHEATTQADLAVTRAVIASAGQGQVRQLMQDLMDQPTGAKTPESE